MSWGEFANGDPDLAAAGAARLSDGYAFLATTRSDGSPRLFEFGVARALLTVHKDKGPVRRRWERDAGVKRSG